MPRYVAFLRGVSPMNAKMAESLGFTDIKLNLDHAFSNGIQFLRRYSEPCWPFLLASPAFVAAVFCFFAFYPYEASASNYHFS